MGKSNPIGCGICSRSSVDLAGAPWLTRMAFRDSQRPKAYLEHPVLSGRLYELCGALLRHKDKSACEIFGDVDEMKLKSSMTLFALTNEDYTVFDEVLECFFDGEMDKLTLKLINGS